MKKLITLTLTLFTFSCWAQKPERLGFSALPMDSTTHLVTYTAVVPVAGATKEQLYLRAREWAARSFVDSKAVARMDDKEAGTYICRGIIPLSNDESYGMMLAIYAKEGRYKYVIDQITYTYKLVIGNNQNLGVTDQAVERWATMGRMNVRFVDARVRNLERIMPKLAANLLAAMTAQASAAKSDW